MSPLRPKLPAALIGNATWSIDADWHLEVRSGWRQRARRMLKRLGGSHSGSSSVSVWSSCSAWNGASSAGLLASGDPALRRMSPPAVGPCSDMLRVVE